MMPTRVQEVAVREQEQVPVTAVQARQRRELPLELQEPELRELAQRINQEPPPPAQVRRVAALLELELRQAQTR